MKPAAVKVGGNQGRMVERRLAVGFQQIVPGVFRTGGGTDRLRLGVLGAPPSRRQRRLLSADFFIEDVLLGRPICATAVEQSPRVFNQGENGQNSLE